MTFWEPIVYGTLGAFALVVVVYLAARVGSLGYFRSKHEYDRSMINKGNGDTDGKRQ